MKRDFYSALSSAEPVRYREAAILHFHPGNDGGTMKQAQKSKKVKKPKVHEEHAYVAALAGEVARVHECLKHLGAWERGRVLRAALFVVDRSVAISG